MESLETTCTKARDLASDRYVPPPLASSRSSRALLFHSTFRKVVVSNPRSVFERTKGLKGEFWHRSPQQQGGGEGPFSMETSNPKEFTSDFLAKIHDEIPVIVPRIFSSPTGPPVQPLFYLSIHPSILDRYWNRESMLADLKVSLRICMQIPWEIIESICSLLPLETKRDGENRDWWEWASGNFETSRSPSAFPPF